MALVLAILCVPVCVCVCLCVCTCMSVSVVSVIVKRPLLPPCAVEGCSKNPLYYYILHVYGCFYLIWLFIVSVFLLKKSLIKNLSSWQCKQMMQEKSMSQTSKAARKNTTRLIFKLFFSSVLNSTAIVHPQIIKSDDQFVPRRLKMYMTMLQKRLHTSAIRNQQEPSRAIAAAVLPR